MEAMTSVEDFLSKKQNTIRPLPPISEKVKVKVRAQKDWGGPPPAGPRAPPSASAALVLREPRSPTPRPTGAVETYPHMAAPGGARPNFLNLEGVTEALGGFGGPELPPCPPSSPHHTTPHPPAPPGTSAHRWAFVRELWFLTVRHVEATQEPVLLGGGANPWAPLPLALPPNTLQFSGGGEGGGRGQRPPE